MDQKITRREFIKRTVTAGAALGVGGVVTAASGLMAQASEGPFDVVEVKGAPSKSVPLAVGLLGGIKRFVPQNAKVVIKANMSFPNPHSMATTTNPLIVREVARLCMEAGAKRVLVLDHVLREPEICLARTGILDACKGLDNVYVKTLNNKNFFQETPVHKGDVLGKVEAARDALSCDVLINLPIAKSHSTVGVTMGFKNMMGLIWDREYFHKVVDINKAIPDLWTVFRPALTILDATLILIDGGPAGPGKVQALNTIVAGRDVLAVDAYTVPLAKWYGRQFQAKNIKHLVNAYNKGLGEMDLKKLKTKRVVA